MIIIYWSHFTATGKSIASIPFRYRRSHVVSLLKSLVVSVEAS